MSASSAVAYVLSPNWCTFMGAGAVHGMLSRVRFGFSILGFNVWVFYLVSGRFSKPTGKST